jgi:hypothetical protein
MNLRAAMSLCSVVAFCLALPATGRSETPPAPSAPGKATLTGKERLGEKWTDEQRLDNCNVPAGKRGTRPRPTCPTPLTH